MPVPVLTDYVRPQMNADAQVFQSAFTPNGALGPCAQHVLHARARSGFIGVYRRLMIFEASFRCQESEIHDGGEAHRVETGAAHQNAVNLGLRH